jgi:hypothetical protein
MRECFVCEAGAVCEFLDVFFRLEVKEFRVAGTDRVLAVECLGRHLQHVASAVGVQVWPAAEVLCEYIAWRSRREGDYFGDRTVLELGAGVGLAGMIASSCSRRVLFTDGADDVLSVLRRNLARNGIDNADVEALEWSDTAQLDRLRERHGRFRRIIASDVVYGSATAGSSGNSNADNSTLLQVCTGSCYAAVLRCGRSSGARRTLDSVLQSAVGISLHRGYGIRVPPVIRPAGAGRVRAGEPLVPHLSDSRPFQREHSAVPSSPLAACSLTGLPTATATGTAYDGRCGLVQQEVPSSSYRDRPLQDPIRLYIFHRRPL